MKTMTVCQKNRTYIPYPNCATRQQIVRRIVDGLIMAASGMGIAAMFLLFFAMA